MSKQNNKLHELLDVSLTPISLKAVVELRDFAMGREREISNHIKTLEAAKDSEYILESKTRDVINKAIDDATFDRANWTLISTHLSNAIDNAIYEYAQ